MARARGTIARPEQSISNVLQDVTNTKARKSARIVGKKAETNKRSLSEMAQEENTASKPSKKPHLAVAKKTSRSTRTAREPLQSISNNTRTVKDEERNEKKSSRPTTRAARKVANTPAQSPRPQSSAPATIATQPMHASQRLPVSSMISSNPAAGTPSVEQSMLVLKSFKRRPRQPSMLNMVKQRLESARSSVAGDAVLLSSDDESLDLDDFMPDAAGTPLYSSGKDTMGFDVHLSRKRKSVDDAELSMPRQNSATHKLRKLVSQSDAEEEETASELSMLSEQDIRISITPDLDLPAHGEESSLNITELAAGSSPIYESSETHSPGGVIRQSQSSVYGPPVSQHTPPPQRETRTTKRLVAPSSAVLQSLLPKRRKQFASTYPMPTLKIAPTSRDSPESDAEHSEFVQTKGRSTRSKQHKTKSSAVTDKMNATKRTAVTKTYAQRRAREAEEEDNDTAAHDGSANASLTLADVSKNDELEIARREFADIDNWEMDYETLTNEESRDSSQGWR